MWTQAKIKFRTLLFDDSGVAMAYTIVTFLVFFMICLSTFAMSENIRRKMELQNACDAAAYSAAVVQADMLSRIAVLNRALSWTYFQTNKRHMDYIIDVWIDAVERQWDNDLDKVIEFNKSSCHPKIPFVCYYATSWGGVGTADVVNAINNITDFRDKKFGEDSDDYESKKTEYFINECNKIFKAAAKGVSGVASQININGRNRWASSIVSAKQYEKLASAIDNANKNMTLIEKETQYLCSNIDLFVKAAAKKAMENSGCSYITEADSNSNGTYDIIAENTYFQEVNSESDLLAYTDKNEEDFEAGYNTWWSLGTEIQRSYSSGLTASYDCFSSHWIHPKYVCIPDNFIFKFTRTIIPDSKKVVSISSNSQINCIAPVGKSKYFSSQRVTATRLQNSFFGKKGSIIVAAQIKSVNPLTVLFGSAGIYNQSLYFSEKLLAVSAARAGIRLKMDQGEDGVYRVFLPDENSLTKYTNKIWNLCEDDWDAVMLPIQYAWSDATATDRKFSAKTANQVLQEVYQRFDRKADCPSDVTSVMWH